jgi:hypothetical protein
LFYYLFLKEFFTYLLLSATQESAAAEILMVRYGLAFAILHSTIDQIHTIHSLSAQTYVPLPEDSTLIKHYE